MIRDPRRVGVVLEVQRYVRNLGGWIYKTRNETQAYNKARSDVESQFRDADLSPVFILHRSDPRISDVGSIVHIRYSEHVASVDLPEPGTAEYSELSQTLSDPSEMDRLLSGSTTSMLAVVGNCDLTIYEAKSERDYHGLKSLALRAALWTIGHHDEKGP